MSTAYVMLTCIPPTTGHLQLVQFATKLADETVVMLGTTPGEPMCNERLFALTAAVGKLQGGPVRVQNLHKDLPQDSSAPGFRELWQGILLGMGCGEGDYIVGSEAYCQWCAEMTGASFMPYDIGREINSARGTSVRNNPAFYWHEIIPEFRPYLQTRITIFGAESVGKTTLSKNLANYLSGAQFVPEYARGYLENTVNEITTRSMTAIWKGQKALQEMPYVDSHLIIQDTDLCSTWGYWDYWQYNRSFDPWSSARLPGGPPQELREDAQTFQSDLYLILPSVVPFEPDPLRYGGDKREIPDDYWINLLSYRQNVCPRPNYHVLGDKPQRWFHEARVLIEAEVEKKLSAISFDRDPARGTD